MGLVFRGDGEGAVAELEVLGLGEVCDEGLWIAFAFGSGIFW